MGKEKNKETRERFRVHNALMAKSHKKWHKNVTQNDEKNKKELSVTARAGDIFSRQIYKCLEDIRARVLARELKNHQA